MRELSVMIELSGTDVYVGDIVGSGPEDACFLYSESYRKNLESRPISVSLPLMGEGFSPDRTRNFFEGLLPEGFTRRCVAEWMQVDANDYLSILAGLGNECLGAIKILEKGVAEIKPEYRRLSEQEVKELAKEGAAESACLVTKAHLSLTGASGKVGLYYDEKEHQWYLPIGNALSTHIVKQSHVRLKRIVTNEQLCLLTARYLGIEIPESFIINLGSSGDDDILFATKRYDRQMNADGKVLNGKQVPYRLHQEDFAQALGISAAAKYEKNKEEGYLKKIFSLIENVSSNPLVDQQRLWDICIFNYLAGNTDNHIKNLSLLYHKDLRTVRLAPAYDIVSTMVYDNSSENMAMSIGGRYTIDDITRNSFGAEASTLGLGVKTAMRRFDRMVSKFPTAIIYAKEELEKQGFDDVDRICERILQRGGIHQYI